MTNSNKIYLRITYFLILFIMIRLGIFYFRTPMKSYGYIIFLIIYLYYYLFNVLDFTNEYGRLTPWVKSLGINLILPILFWSFSKSEVIFLKFFLLWVGSNILRMIMVKLYKRNGTYRGVYVGNYSEFAGIKNGFEKRNFGLLNFLDSKKIKNYDDLEKYIFLKNLDLIIINEEFMRSFEVEFLKLKIKGYKIYCQWQFMQEIERKINVEKIKDKWFLYSEGFHILHNTFQINLKRFFDISIVIIISLVTFPIIILTYFLIKLDGGPALFKQKRIGLGGEEFEIIKFRSMRVDAEKNGARWAEKNDSRITKFGSFLRKIRIDELPQLWNVFKGEMSFVGPRPERKVFIDELEKVIPYYNIRHSIKPGLTGWAQVMYPYGASVEDALHKLEYDLYYLKHQNFMFDLMVFFKTMKVVLSREGI